MTRILRASLVATFALCASQLNACQGNFGEQSGKLDDSPNNRAPNDDPREGPTQFTCDSSLAIPTPGMRRLTRRQYENSLRDLIASRLSPEATLDILQQLQPTLALIPTDERAKLAQDPHGSYRRLDQSVQQAHVDYWYETGVLAGKLLSQSEHLGALIGECATDGDAGNDANCLSDFVEQFGALVLRRPLSSEERSHYESFYAPSTGIDPAGFADVIAGLLNAPQFLYIVEHTAEAEPSEADTEKTSSPKLSAYELASRLSYHFWNTMPDTRLLELASSGKLLESDTYQAEVDRLFNDERTRFTLREFFLEWMKLEDLPDLDANNDAPVFASFAGASLPSAELRAAMIEEVVDMLDYFTWQQPGGIEQLFTNVYSFAKSDELATIYGIEPWNGEDTPPLLQASRTGLLTRGAFLSTGTANTRPIMKGLFIRQNILCDKIPPPPENAMAIPPDLSPDLSTRQVVETLTETPGTSCAGCHEALINPLGFATEGFDSLGRSRSQQTLFDEAGNVLTQVSIDSSSVPQILNGDMSESKGPEDLMKLLIESGKPTACAVRHYFRFSFGRWEGVVSDGCALESMRVALEETGSLAGMLKSVALTESFQSKTFDNTAASKGSN